MTVFPPEHAYWDGISLEHALPVGFFLLVESIIDSWRVSVEFSMGCGSEQLICSRAYIVGSAND